ncbi:MAG: HD domain-containing phosphohydrolase [Negativicutes bacterium]|nr:HD domain-containing phosphohydrolase [Negativicutes bacterium]
MKRIRSYDLQPGMMVAEAVFSLDRKQILVDAGATLTERIISQINNWDIPYVLVVEEGEELAPPVAVDEPEPVEPDLSALPDVMAQKTVNFVQNFEAAIIQVNGLMEDIRETKTVDMDPIREVAAQVVKYLIQPSEAINRMLFRMPPRTAPHYLAYHSIAVAALSGMLTKWMELTPGSLNDLVMAGMLHDIGKTQLPRSLMAEDQLLPEHAQMAKQHVLLAVKLLREIRGISPNVQAAVLQHHECLDGSGFPRGLTGDQIHPYARIVAVANRLCDIVSESSRLNPFSMAEIIKREMFTKLDPTVGDTFIRRFNDYLMNNPVRLSDGRKAKVVFLPSVNPTSPVLKTDDDQFIDLTKEKVIKIEGIAF